MSQPDPEQLDQLIRQYSKGRRRLTILRRSGRRGRGTPKTARRAARSEDQEDLTARLLTRPAASPLLLSSRWCRVQLV